jgi:hypothetical protein
MYSYKLQGRRSLFEDLLPEKILLVCQFAFGTMVTELLQLHARFNLSPYKHFQRSICRRECDQLFTMSMKYASSGGAAWVLKCTDLPQFDALAAAADLFRTDDKLHLRILLQRFGSLLRSNQPNDRIPTQTHFGLQSTMRHGEPWNCCSTSRMLWADGSSREAMRSGERINLGRYASSSSCTPYAC